MTDREREGYVLVDRNILDWRYWQKHNTLIVFLWLLFKANFHESYFCGVKVERGQVATTIGKIGFFNKFTVQEVRTALNSLKSTGEITIKRYPKFLVITISKYDKYQNLTFKATNDQQSNNNQTTIKQQYPNTYNTYNTDQRRNIRSAQTSIKTVDNITEEDLKDCLPFEQMPNEAEGTKRDIPKHLREAFNGDYGAYWRFMERWVTKSQQTMQ